MAGRPKSLAWSLIPVACAPDPEQQRLERTIAAEYNEDTGRLELLTYDSNDNGTIDVWTYMAGTAVLRAEVDADEDGVIERWEYYDEDQRLEKVGFSRANDGVVDGWAYEGTDGGISRVELSTLRDGSVDRWEYYEADVMTRAEEDVNQDGRVDKWETFADDALETVAFDEDGRPDRRLTYGQGGALATIESEPDATGRYTRSVAVDDSP